MPEGDPAVPEGDPAVPEGIPAAPEGIPAVPEGIPAVPEGIPAVPEGEVGARKRFLSSQDGALSAEPHEAAGGNETLAVTRPYSARISLHQRG